MSHYPSSGKIGQGLIRAFDSTSGEKAEINLRHHQAFGGSKYHQTFTFEACRLRRIRRYRDGYLVSVYPDRVSRLRRACVSDIHPPHCRARARPGQGRSKGWPYAGEGGKKKFTVGQHLCEIALDSILKLDRAERHEEPAPDVEPTDDLSSFRQPWLSVARCFAPTLAAQGRRLPSECADQRSS